MTPIKYVTEQLNDKKINSILDVVVKEVQKIDSLQCR